MSTVLHAARVAMPDLKMDDAELRKLIARELLASGCDIDYDAIRTEAEFVVKR
jgi:hypothetical protein